MLSCIAPGLIPLIASQSLSNNYRSYSNQAGMNYQTRSTNEFSILLIVTTTNTAISALNLCLLTSVNAADIIYQNEQSFMNRPAWQILNIGENKCVTGNNLIWYGSTRQLMISSLKQLRWHWPPNRRQRRHLS